MAGGGVQKIYMVFLRESSRRDRSGSDLFHLRDGFEIKMNFDRVDVGYLTGETDEKTYAMSHACAFTGLSSSSIAAVRSWIGTPRAPQKNNHTHDGDPMPEYRAATINRLLSSPKFPELATKLLTLQEMSAIWSNNPQKFEGILGSLANDNDLPDDLALQLLLGAFYGMASESFSALLHDAYPMPE